MNFKGGVIIIGSLIWDHTSIRDKWLKVAFKNSKVRVKTPVKIRYGRESETRSNTYSMILSNHTTTQFGEAFILEFKVPIMNFETLETQAYYLANAEGICKDISRPTLNANWGTVGILLNPSIEAKDKPNAYLIINRWKQLYEQYKNFDPADYIIDKNEHPVIDKIGILKIDWVKEMDEFDLLLATPTRPNTSHPLLPKEIADRMNEKKYREYFDNNIANKISTFQDTEIVNYLITLIDP